VTRSKSQKRREGSKDSGGGAKEEPRWEKEVKLGKELPSGKEPTEIRIFGLRPNEKKKLEKAISTPKKGKEKDSNKSNQETSCVNRLHKGGGGEEQSRMKRIKLQELKTKIGKDRKGGANGNTIDMGHVTNCRRDVQ